MRWGVKKRDVLGWTPSTVDYINIIINNTLWLLHQLLLHLEGTENIPKKLSEFIGLGSTKSNAYGNETQTMTKVEEKADLKQRFNNIISCLDDAKKEVRHIWWFLIIVNFDRYTSHTIGGAKTQRAGRLSSYLRLIGNKLQERLDIARGKSYRSRKLKFGMPVQTHK